MSDTNIRAIEGGLKIEQDAAEDLIVHLKPIMHQVADILNRARVLGLDIQLGWTNDQFGRYVPTATVVKPLARL